MENKAAVQQRLGLVSPSKDVPKACQKKSEEGCVTMKKGGAPVAKVRRLGMKPEENNQKLASVSSSNLPGTTDVKDLVTECNCMVKLDEALRATPYFSSFPQRLHEQEAFCQKKLAQVEMGIEKTVSTLREDQESIYEYDRLIAEARLKFEEALTKLEATKEELKQLENQTDVRGQQYHERESMLQKESEAVLQLELQIRTKQCEQVSIKLQALKNRSEFNSNLLDQIDEEINSLKRNLVQRKEQVKSFEQLLQEARENLAACEGVLQKLRDRVDEESKAVQRFREEEERYRGEKKEMQDVIDNSMEKRRKYVLAKFDLEKHLLKLSFVKAHHALQRKAHFYQDSRNFLLDYHDDEPCEFPD